MIHVYTVNTMRRLLEDPTRVAKQARDEELEKVKQVCACLNLGKRPFTVIGSGPTLRGFETWDFTPFRDALRKLVKEWQDSGPNMELMIARNPTLWQKIENVLIELKPTNTGAVKVELAAIPPEEKFSDFERFVHAFFLLLIMSPYWNRLGGPCARCGNYYVKKTIRQKVYCSKRCGLMETSIETNRRRRNEQHKQKVKKALEVISKWESTRTRKSWKVWVSERTGFTRIWLTRALSRGDLHEPTKEVLRSGKPMAQKRNF